MSFDFSFLHFLMIAYLVVSVFFACVFFFFSTDVYGE